MNVFTIILEGWSMTTTRMLGAGERLMNMTLPSIRSITRLGIRVASGRRGGQHL